MTMHILFIKFLSFLLFLSFISCEPKTGPAKLMLEEPMEEEVTSSVLIKNLDSLDVYTRSQACIQLGSRKEKKAIPKLRILLGDKEPGVRAGAAIALGDLGDTSVTNRITELLEKDKENPKDIYLDALSRMKDPKAGSKIYGFLDSEDSTLRLQAVEALVQIGASDQGPSIVKLASANKDREKDKTYAMAIGKLKAKSGETYLLSLTKIKDDSPTLAASFLALGRIKSKLAIEVLVNALKENYSKGKENASMALIEIGDTKAVSLSFPLLDIDEAETRMYVTDVLSEIPAPFAGERAIQYLNSDKKFAWGSAARIIGRQRYKSGREKLEQMLLLDSTPDRDMFAEALGWLGDKKSIPVLRQVLNSKSKSGRYGSAWSLGILGAKEALPDLQNALKDSDPKLVTFALEAIGSIADESSLPALKELLQDRPKMAPQILSAVGLIKTDAARLVLEDAAKTSDANVFRPAFEEIAKRKSMDSLPFLFEMLNVDETEKRKITYYALTAVTGEHFRTKNDWITWRAKRK